MEKKLKDNLPILVFALLFIIGILVMFYPSISDYMNSSKYNNTITMYNITAENPNKAVLELAKKYNRMLTTNDILDSFSDPERPSSSDYVNILNINGDGIMGYIEIPKINIKIPIYHGTGEESLQKGVGHLEGSSLPIGGKGTHAVLSAHRGLPTARLFTDLDQLKKGDLFYIYSLDEVLAYQVDQILITEPNETDSLTIDENEDYITLVTCTPYAVNTHRLLVRGTRVKYEEETIKNIKRANYISLSDLYLIIGIYIVDLVLIIAIIMTKHVQYKNNKVKNIIGIQMTS